MPLNHPLLTWGPRQAGTVAGTAFVGMVTGHCWGKRPSADPGLKRAAAHRAPGTHYPVWHCVTLWVCVVRASGNVDVIRVSFFMYLKSSFYFDMFLFPELFLLSDLKTRLVERVTSLLFFAQVEMMLSEGVFRLNFREIFPSCISPLQFLYFYFIHSTVIKQTTVQT